jgi:hypothetical protein
MLQNLQVWWEQLVPHICWGRGGIQTLIWAPTSLCSDFPQVPRILSSLWRVLGIVLQDMGNTTCTREKHPISQSTPALWCIWALCCRPEGVFRTVIQTGPHFLLHRQSGPQLTTATAIKFPSPWWKRLIWRSGPKPPAAATSWKGKVDPWWCISPCLTKTTVEVGAQGSAGWTATKPDQMGRLCYAQGTPGLPSNVSKARKSEQEACWVMGMSYFLSQSWIVLSVFVGILSLAE